MKKLILFLTIFLAFITVSTPVLAAPECQITGTVLETNLIPAFEDACVKARNCPKNTVSSAPERYIIKLRLSDVKDCTNLFKPGDESSFSLVKTKVREGDSINKDDIIQTTPTDSDLGISIDSYQKFPAPKSLTATSSAVPSHNESPLTWFSGIIQKIISTIVAFFRK